MYVPHIFSTDPHPPALYQKPWWISYIITHYTQQTNFWAIAEQGG